MTYEPLNRRLATLAAIIAFLGIVLGVIALATNYWTVRTILEPTNNATMPVDPQPQLGYGWNGLFQACTTRQGCVAQFWGVTFVICLLGILFLLAGGIFSILDIPKATDRRFIAPMLIFVGCVLMTAGLVHYASVDLLNSHSSRSMIAAVVFAYSALPISAFVAGRYSALERTVLVNNGATQKYSATGSGL